jgi:hypothetical protein
MDFEDLDDGLTNIAYIGMTNIAIFAASICQYWLHAQPPVGYPHSLLLAPPILLIGDSEIL